MMPVKATATGSSGRERTGGDWMPPFAVEPLIAANLKSVETAAETQEQFFKRAARVNEEIFKFVDTRLQANREAAKAFATCQTPQEGFAVCSKFVETMMRQYAQEMTLITSLYGDQTRDAIVEVQKNVEATVQTVTEVARNGQQG